MKWNEQIAADRKKLSEMKSVKEKLLFVWDYYRFGFLAGAVVLVLLVSFLIQSVFAPRPLFYAVFLNSDAAIRECDPSLLEKEAEKAGLNTKKKIDVDDTLHLGQKQQEEEDMSTRQVLLALFSLGEVDLFVCEEEYFEAYAREGAFLDLSQYEELKEILASDGYSVTLLEDQSERTCGVWLKDGVLFEAGYYHKPVLAGICEQGKLQKNALDFLIQITE